jgi:hypothetical protein
MKNKRAVFGVFAQRGKGPVMHFDGKKITNNGSAKSFSWPMAHKMARGLKKKFAVLTGYRLWVRPIAGLRNNPESLDEAARKLEDFSGHDPDKVISAELPHVKTGLVIGELDLIGYRTKREGIDGGRLVRYGHQFRKKSRPLLAVSKDGTQLLIVGGRYEFTEAGIEDR